MKDAANTALKAGVAAHANGRLDEGEKQFLAAIDLATKAGSEADGIRCSALSSLSTIHTTRREFTIAESLLDEATEIVSTRNWRATVRHVGVLTNVAVLKWHMGQRAESLEVLKFAHAEFSPRANSEADHRALAGLLRNIVAYYAEACDSENADQWSLAAIAHCRVRGTSLPADWAEIIGRRC